MTLIYSMHLNSFFYIDLSVLVCVDMFVFQVGLASVNQLEMVIGPLCIFLRYNDLPKHWSSAFEPR